MVIELKVRWTGSTEESATEGVTRLRFPLWVRPTTPKGAARDQDMCVTSVDGCETVRHVSTCWHPTYRAAWMHPTRSAATEGYSVDSPRSRGGLWLARRRPCTSIGPIGAIQNLPVLVLPFFDRDNVEGEVI